MGCSSSRDTNRNNPINNKEAIFIKQIKLHSINTNPHHYKRISFNQNNPNTISTTTSFYNNNSRYNFHRKSSSISYNKPTYLSHSTNNQLSSPNLSSTTKQKRYSGLIITGDFSELFLSAPSKDSFLQMIKTALRNSAKQSSKLTNEQVTLISSLVYGSVKEGTRFIDDYNRPLSEYIKHPSLNNVLVKMSIKKVTKEIFKSENCFKSKHINNEDIKREFNVEDSEDRKLKVLSIEII